MPTPMATAVEQARVVQGALALPPGAMAIPAQRTTEAPLAATAAVTTAPAAVRPDPAMVRLLGEAPTPSTTESLPPAMAPHLYHLGGVTFFLDRQELALTLEQRSKLSAIREIAVLTYATTQRKIDQGEQELWMLTAADRPDARRVEAKLNEIARFSTLQRMDFIRAIGLAVASLSEIQQKVLSMPSASSPLAVPMPTDSGSAVPPASGPMGGTPGAPMTDAGSGGMEGM